ncbi:MAG: mechanosensitive ion channel family protein [Rhodospirillales bacterium]|nr:mechanosensitive ion channel family protein [Rhodospirillales bacterium]
MGAGVGAVRGRLEDIGLAAAGVPSALSIVVAWLAQGENQRLVATTVLLTGLVIAAGFGLEVLPRRLFRRIGADGKGQPWGNAGVVGRLFLGLTTEFFLVSAFAAGSLGTLALLYDQDEAAFPLLLSLVGAVVVIRLIAALARLLLSPREPAARLLPVGDREADLLSRQLMTLAGVLVMFRIVYELARGAGEGVRGLLALAMIWLFALALSRAIWHCRDLIYRYFRREGAGASAASTVPGGVAAWLHRVAIGYVVVAAVAASLVRLATGNSIAGPILATFAVLLVAPLADWLLRVGARSVVRALSGPAAAPEKEDPGAVRRREAYERVLVHNGRVLLSVGAVLAMAAVWSIDIGTAAESGLGTRVGGALFDIVVTLTLASALWGLVRAALRHGAVEAAAGDGEVAAAGAASRLQTVLPLFGNVVLVNIAVIAGLVVLSSLGVDIAPLIAGAGVVGIALGFGAQTLVRDVLSGVFLLIEDAFRVGEYVDVGAAKGTVENISLRYLRLRHHLGPINTIPFGEIKTLTNFSRDWAIMKLELRVPYSADLEKVRKIVKSVGQELLAHPEYGPNFLQPLKSQGVHRMDDSAFIIRVKFMAKPGEQFVLRREVFRRIQQAFAAEGIEFAPRRVIVDGAAKDAAAAASMADEGVRPSGAAPAA